MSLRERTRPGLGIIEPYLPSPAKAPGWLHEIKHDGIRIMARRDSAGVRLITRHGTDNAGRISPTGVGGARAASDSAGCLSPFPAAVDRRRARGLLHRQGVADRGPVAQSAVRGSNPALRLNASQSPNQNCAKR